MGRDSYQEAMESRIRDLSFQIECIKTRLLDSADFGLKRELAMQIDRLEHRRDRVRQKLDALYDEPDGTWEDLRLEVEDEWDALVQDFEERVANLA